MPELEAIPPRLKGTLPFDNAATSTGAWHFDTKDDPGTIVESVTPHRSIFCKTKSGKINHLKVRVTKRYLKIEGKIRQLVSGIPTPLKNIKVSWDDYSQYMGKMFQTTR